MRHEWADAGVGRRVLFGMTAFYWIGIAALFVANVVSASGGYEAGRITGFFFTPLLFAALVRAAYVLLSRRRPRPRFWSWWLFVIGMAIGLVLAVQRAVVALAERAA